jgi:hypothetical protein
MYNVRFIVFASKPNTLDEAKLIKTFHDLGYSTFVDGKHKSDYGWLMQNVEVGKLFIYDSDEVYMFGKDQLDRDMIFTPDFAVIFNSEDQVTEEQWDCIHLYLKQHLTDEMIDMTNTMKVHEMLGKPTFEKAALPEVEAPVQQTHYSFDCKYLEEDDIMLYQVIKPFTDLPYTSVTREYSRKGHIPFFTDLFICQSWGVARNDIGFLKHMWTELKMDGEFDLESLMKDATEKCYPSETNMPNAEPEVYRRCIDDVIQILHEKIIRKGHRNLPSFIKQTQSQMSNDEDQQ